MTPAGPLDPVIVLLVALGSALGAMARYGLSGWIGHRVGERFPWGTFAVNASGCLLAGALLGVLAGSPWAAFALTGFLGSYTTVSSFSLQTLQLVSSGRLRAALGNTAGSVAVCVGAAWAGAGLAATVAGAG